MPGRKYNAGSNSYRYGQNGQEKDNELNENIYTAEYWEYDSRIVRRWNIDPVPKTGESPYMCFSGNPIMFADPHGDDKEPTVSGNRKETRSLKKYEKKFDKLVAGGMSKDDAYKEMQYKYGQKKWFYVADKNTGQSGEGFVYHNVGRLFMNQQAAQEPPSTQQVGLVNNGTDGSLWQVNGKSANAVAMKFSIPPELNITGGSYPVEFTINNNVPDPFLYLVNQGAGFLSSYSDLSSGSVSSISNPFLAEPNSTIRTGPITINVDKGGAITIIGYPRTDDTHGSGSLGSTAPSATGFITVPKPVLRVQTAFTVVLKTPSAQANTLGNGGTNKHPEKLTQRTRYELDMQYYLGERKR